MAKVGVILRSVNGMQIVVENGKDLAIENVETTQTRRQSSQTLEWKKGKLLAGPPKMIGRII